MADENGKTIEPTKKLSRIQIRNREKILDGALEAFSTTGFHATSLDTIASFAGMSKQNLLYYFPNKETIYRTLLESQLDGWLDELGQMKPDGDPMTEILQYMCRKFICARDEPRESRLFAIEVMSGAPFINDLIAEHQKSTVDEKCALIQSWMDAGKLAKLDPYHLIFSIWTTTENYANGDVQIRALLGPNRNGPERFEEAEAFLVQLYRNALQPILEKT